MLTSVVYRILASQRAADDLPAGYWSRVDDEHQAILEAVDPDAAETVMRAHMEASKVGQVVTCGGVASDKS